MAALTMGPASAQTPQDSAPPRILLDQSPRAIDYQLRRLSNDDLARVERRADDVRYVPVYYALLTRELMADVVREEAIVALMAIEKTPRVGVLLEALQRATAATAAAPLQRLLLALPVADLALARERFADATARADASPFLLQGAYVAMMLATREVAATWDAATSRDGHRLELLRGLASLPASADADTLRRDLAPGVAAVVETPTSDEEHVAAVAAVAATRRDGEAFGLLADVVAQGRTAAAVAAAVDGLALIPEREWPAARIEPLVAHIVARVSALPPDARVAREAIDAIAMADRLAGALPSTVSRARRAELRALGVRVVRIEAKPEQVAFDVRWFVVEAGKPVQIVLFNPDAMPHNVVVGAPGSLELIGTTGSAMPMPTEPSVKPFVPGVPEVIAATPLVTQGNTGRLGFVAPTATGEYVFACTFPGHWTRMYGVMLVVPSVDGWEAAPTVPIDPMTKQPFASQRSE